MNADARNDALRSTLPIFNRKFFDLIGVNRRSPAVAKGLVFFKRIYYGHQSATAPESLTTFAHFFISLRMCAPNSAGVLPSVTESTAR